MLKKKIMALALAAALTVTTVTGCGTGLADSTYAGQTVYGKVTEIGTNSITVDLGTPAEDTENTAAQSPENTGTDSTETVPAESGTTAPSAPPDGNAPETNGDADTADPGQTGDSSADAADNSETANTGASAETSNAAADSSEAANADANAETTNAVTESSQTTAAADNDTAANDANTAGAGSEAATNEASADSAANTTDDSTKTAQSDTSKSGESDSKKDSKTTKKAHNTNVTDLEMTGESRTFTVTEDTKITENSGSMKGGHGGGGQPPAKPGENSTANGDNGTGENGQPPAKPGDNSTTDTSNGTSENGQPPAKPEENSSADGSTLSADGQPPAMPENGEASAPEGAPEAPPEMNTESASDENTAQQVSAAEGTQASESGDSTASQTATDQSGKQGKPSGQKPDGTMKDGGKKAKKSDSEESGSDGTTQNDDAASTEDSQSAAQPDDAAASESSGDAASDAAADNGSSESEEQGTSDTKTKKDKSKKSDSKSDSDSSDSSGKKDSSDSKKSKSLALTDIEVGDIVEITIDENGKTESIEIQASEDDQEMPGGQASEVTEYTAVKEYDEDTTVKGETIASTGSEENAIHASGGAEVTLKDLTVTRKSDDKGGDSSSFYGVGAAILETDGTAYISDSTIETESGGGAGVFAYGDGKVYVADTKITTTEGTSGGIHAAGGGTLYAWDLDVETNGGSSAAIRSDRGGGTMVVDGGTYTSNGTGSPAIYSTANITVNDADLEATASEAICIEGDNTIRLYDCDLTGNMGDDAQNDTTWNVILYQSMSGDSEEGNSTFEMVGGTLTAKNGGMFYTTNTESTFLLKDVEITNAADSEFLLQCTGNNNQRGWGQTGSNGADCLFTAVSQEMEGNVIWDSISELDLYLTDTSTWKGAFVNDESNAGDGGDGHANLYIESGSTWTVTGDSTLSNLYNAGTIVDADGQTVTVKGTDGTVYVEGTSSYTITVNSYSTSADVSGAAKAGSFSDYAVDRPKSV